MWCILSRRTFTRARSFVRVSAGVSMAVGCETFGKRRTCAHLGSAARLASMARLRPGRSASTRPPSQSVPLQPSETGGSPYRPASSVPAYRPATVGHNRVVISPLLEASVSGIAEILRDRMQEFVGRPIQRRRDRPRRERKPKPERKPEVLPISPPKRLIEP